MKKILKILLSFLLVFSLCACQSKKEYPSFTLKLFYYDTCSRCKAFKESAIPALREEFNNQFEIEYYNLDNDDAKSVYDDIINQLDDFEKEYYGETPLVVLNQDWAILGYNGSEENEELIKEIKRTLDGEPLGDYYAIGRYLFKQGE